jgi:raffinose/stachyose/melibiose transport system substrate-binding protein
MMKRRAAAAAVAVAAATSLALAACSSGASNSTTPSSNGSSGHVTLTWWNNGTNQPLLGVWQSVVKSFEASHPNITIQNIPVQNEQFTTKVPLALHGNNPPDIYQQWGGGAEATQIKTGKVTDLTPNVSSWIGELGAGAAGWQVGGKQYGVPFDLHVVGMWYRKDLFKRAGITSPPATIADLKADDTKLKAAGIAPIAIGSKDRWPDAFWWEYFAVRECSQATVTSAMTNINLSDPCFSKASADLTDFLKTNPFQTGYLGTPAQQGAGSSAGLVASGKAAMELQGDWDASTMEGVSTNKNLPSELGWFPFPSVPGAAGSQTAVLGGGDGFSCTNNAPEPACSQFLQYLDTPAIQAQLIKVASPGLPANPAAVSAITLPAELSAAAADKAAPYVATYFDTALPTQPGQNLDTALANFFSGQGSASAIISSIQGPA